MKIFLKFYLPVILGAIITGIFGLYSGWFTAQLPIQTPKSNMNAGQSDTVLTHNHNSSYVLKEPDNSKSDTNNSRLGLQEDSANPTPTTSTIPPSTKKMITVHLVIDNHLRNGEVFVDGKQVISNPDATVKTIKVVGFMEHEIMVATKTDTCRTSGYFDTNNMSISMNCE